MTRIILSDASLRDGNHAIRHQITRASIAAYCTAAENAGVPIVEVGHGNGLGASSIQVGLSLESDEVMLSVARDSLRQSKLGVHVIPGFATIYRDLALAIDRGVDVFRVASHCTEADITSKHISFLRSKEREVYGVLMMSHLATTSTLVKEALKMESYGAEAIVIMDSAGAYLPDDVTERVSELRDALECNIGFHGHNNLGMAVSNSMAAVRSGATILDGCARGFGAGAGNTQIELLVAILAKENYQTGIDLYKMLDAADLAERQFAKTLPVISSSAIVSGVNGVFSGYLPRVLMAATEYGVDPRDIFYHLGMQKVVAGQEDLIIKVAMDLANETA